METGVIVIITYLVGELYKNIFINKKELYRFIPIIVTILGGIMGVIMYMVIPIENIENVFEALYLGLISGASSTGTNQIIKQLGWINEGDNEGS